MVRPSRLDWVVDVVRATARRSTCVRRGVAAVLLNDKGHILATGYNGVPAGMPHCNHLEPDGTRPHICPGGCSASGANLDGCYAIHAEQNALLQCKDVHDIDTCVVSCAPCITCAKLLLNTSCRRIVFLEDYPHSDSRKLWEAMGREWKKYLPGGR